MILNSKAVALLLLTICHTSRAWTTLQTSQVVPGAMPSIQSKNPLLLSSPSPTVRTSLTVLSETTSDENMPKRKRKRKKKVQVVDEAEDDEPAVVVEVTEPEPKPELEPEPEPEPEPVPVMELKPQDAPVQLEVKNILASDAPPEPSAVSQISSMLSSVMGGSNEEESKPRKSSSVGSSFESQSMDDAMSQLLEDARMMTEEDKEGKGLLSDEEGKGIKAIIGDTLSTIVTVDFFVVLGFLGWFLLGIFSRSVFGNDTIQIAFNNNFEKFVQPALGILMIASLGSNFFKKEEEYDL